jgi:hypothetical protein
MTAQIVLAVLAIVSACLTVAKVGDGSMLYFIYPLSTAISFTALLVLAHGKEPLPSTAQNKQNA